MLKNLLKCFSILSLPMLIGCGATHTALNKKDLDVQNKMSHSIFLEPVAPEKRVVFLHIRNSSDKPDLMVANQVKTAIKQKGYVITDNPDKAQYMVQANILQVSKSNLKDNQSALSAGFGGAIAGATVGGIASGGKNEAIAVGGLIGSALGLTADAMVKDVAYTIITDLQISEKPAKETKAHVRQRIKSRLQQGTSASIEQRFGSRSQWLKYQTRIVSTANKANLSFEEAQPWLISGLSNTISGIL